MKFAASLLLFIFGPLFVSSTLGQTTVTHINALSGSIKYPPLPTQYGANEDVGWLVNHTEYGGRIRFDVKFLSIELCGNCACDYLNIYDGPDKSYTRLANLCGSTVVYSIYSTGSVAFVHFVSDGTVFASGFVIDFANIESDYSMTTTSAPSSTRAITLPHDSTIQEWSGVIAYPEVYGAYYGIYEEKTWRIDQRQYGQGTIQFNLTRLDIERCSGCTCDSVQIYDGLIMTDSNRIAALCGSTLPTQRIFTTTGPTALIKFYSDHSNNGLGFSFDFTGKGQMTETTTAADVIEANITTLYDSVGVIRHPPFGGTYQNNEDFIWRIDQRQYGNGQIKLTFGQVFIEQCDNCNCDSIEIFDSLDPNQWTRLIKVCGVDSINSVYYSSGPVAAVRFRSNDAVNYYGFAISYSRYEIPTTTASPTTTTEPPSNNNLTYWITDLIGTVKHPQNGGNYGDNEVITWHIDQRSEGQTSIRLEFTALNLQTCTYCSCDYVEIYDGIDPNYSNVISRTCASDNSMDYQPVFTTGPVATIRFKSDSSVTRPGFAINFRTMNGTTTNLTNSLGVIIHPESGLRYNNYESYIWKIDHRSYGNVPIKLTLESMNIEYDATCRFDVLQIYDALNPSASQPMVSLCGERNDAPVYYSTGPVASVWFKSDSSTVSRGFRLKFERNEVVTTMVPTTVQPAVPTFYSWLGTIQYPLNNSANYPSNDRQVWYIDMRMYGNNPIKFTISYLDIEYASSCQYDSLELFNEFSTNSENRIVKRCGQGNTGSYFSQGPTATVYFTSDGTNEYSGFIVEFIGVDNSENITTLYERSGTLVHPINGEYESNENYIWFIDLRQYGSFLKVKIDITFISVESSSGSSCDYDGLEIYDTMTLEANNLLGRYCGGRTPGYSIYSSGPTATVRFYSDYTQEYRGFELSYSTSYDHETTVSWTNETTQTTRQISTTEPSVSLPWPLPSDLLGFWPLDKVAGLSDISGKALSSCSFCRGTLAVEVVGPFGQKGTSHNRTSSNQPVLSIEGVRPVVNSSITVSMFVYVPHSFSDVGSSGLLSFSDSMGNSRLQIDVVNINFRPHLRIRGPDNTGAAYGVYDILYPGDWSFFAIQIENSKWSPCMLSVYGRHGLAYSAVYKQNMCADLQWNNNIKLGYSHPDGGSAYSPANFSFSCLMLYSTTLTEAEVRDVYQACRAAHGTPPCGAPLIPYPPVPQASNTVPKNGQFPWIASIRHKSNENSVVCAASIFDGYFLITSASCFGKNGVSPNPSDYSVRVGDFDSTIVESSEQKHFVKNIEVYPFYNDTVGDIALIELTSPIDFSSLYVNSMCAPEFEFSSTGKIAENQTLYFFGWGQYGRASLVALTTPRYVAGMTVSNSQCASTYPEEFRKPLSTCFLPDISAARRVPCSGDEGGPLMVAGEDKLGNECLRPVAIFTKHADCSADKPALFTLIAPYMQWITQKTACAIPGYTYPASCPVSGV